MIGTRRGTTRADVLVMLAVLPVVAGFVVPALSAMRGSSRAEASADNLRVLGAAHLVYAAEWNGRQLTFVDDVISTYGSGIYDAFVNYASEHGSGESNQHPPVKLGWGRLQRSGGIGWLAYRTAGNPANASLTLPIVFTEPSNLVFNGAFRLGSALQFNEYLNGRFYDHLFYAPADTVVIEAIGEEFEDPFQYSRFANVSSAVGEIPAWSSYCLSPAAMFNPEVMRRDDPADPDANGWTDPWSFDDGFASPSYFHAAYPSLKTHMLEHHWLQDAPEPCNPAFEEGTYGDDGCEPYYFNHGFDSRPVTLFYDGHVAELPVAEGIAADEMVREQNGGAWGLWSRDTPWGVDGYLSQYGYDGAVTSFHILTTDGIEGRDVTAVALDAPRRVGSMRRDVHRARRDTPAGDAARAPRLSLTD